MLLSWAAPHVLLLLQHIAISVSVPGDQGNPGHVKGKTPIGSHSKIIYGLSFSPLHLASLKGLAMRFGLTRGALGPRPGGSNFNALHGQGFRGCSVNALNCMPLVSHSFLPVSVTGALI